jgi:hypothetical protein
MTEESFALLIQTLAVVAAVGASLVALVISALDRRNAREIAAHDRARSIELANLIFERDALLRLSENLARGGSSDKLERARMGAESLAITSAIGPERLPLGWADRVDMSEEEIAAFVADEAGPLWTRKSAEAALALSRVTRELRDLISKDRETND